MTVVSINGAALNYEEVGSGDPFVYLAYTRFDSAALWVPYMREHAAGFRVILPDPRGMAGSVHQTDVSPEQWVSDLVGLLDALDLSSVRLVSETLGCRVAARVAADHPERVKTLVLNAPIAYSSPESDAVRRQSADPANMPRERQDLMRQLHGDDWQAVNAFYQGMHEREDFKRYYDLREVAPRIQAPTLVMRGDVDEPVHPIAHATAVHERLPRSWLAIMPSTPFNVLRARPRESWELMRTFFAAHQ
jgi:pimeloyl-ACP methyl ester carboxylesterase